MQIRDLAFIDTLRRKSAVYVSEVKGALREELERYSWSRFHGPLMYALEGGKRVRPLILLLSSESVGGDIREALSSAVAVELLHTESIIHDDIIDNEVSRRERLAFHIKYGFGASMLTADFVFGIILSIASRQDNQRVARELSLAALKMCEGEFAELKVDPRECKLDWDAYIDILSKKTASLFQTAARIGGIMGGGSEDDVSALSNYGLSLGIAYQIQDDILDWGSEGKVTEALGVQTDDVIEHLSRMSKSYAVQAKNALRPLPESGARNLLEELADFTVLRQY